ncbi:CAIB/BAIF family enzyme [Penicillium odoratum]|uniref:CAIB/BAIF family enzyme n=1 Tax=Penicillium odoratum TaxID=1167516 RepID=UPI0025478B82|nr:CAIB/BAIF family enzyme [Penicillium odoratum]KAJ5769524.1 CAIB/BAIF family enzyme [Penicillium odoratum]
MIDISRVIAGPTIAKMAALLGATVIRKSCSSQPDMGSLLVDENLEKRDVTLDLKSVEGKKTLRDLLAVADVFLDVYRPVAMESLGFGPEYVQGLAKKRGKGIVYVRENCCGGKGPSQTAAAGSK